ncbi:MAG: tRNA epoxyqueuosine(34) reductase QueG [Cytophagaceae bacterium]|jgi:epoxyqueuosine reductase|nr:tRNA epoxyqueuosine(34) reductase QueG [Cytophagaceae bacterium]
MLSNSYQGLSLSQRIKLKALDLGFDYCGISKATFLEQEAPRLEEWLKRGYQGSMAWMENHFDKRLDPRKLVEGAKSVITVLLNYYPEQTLQGNLKISRYAYGDDYHQVIKEKLAALLAEIRAQAGEVQGRAFVDSAPVMDKVWAERAGAGWVGKNANLIVKKGGSYFFIGELILDLELDYDGPIGDYCGTCRRCMDACPTQAITEPYVVDGSKCISYLTIELKDQINETFQGQMDNWVYGCDVCQEVCPWNRFAQAHQTPEFLPSEALQQLSSQDFKEITEELFKTVFKESAVKRTKWKGFVRNISFVNSGSNEV